MRLGTKHSEESRKKLSESNKGQVAWNKGKPCSEQQKEKLRSCLLGRKLSEEHKRKISESYQGVKNHFYGKHHTEEYCRLKSESLIGKKHPPRSEEWKQNIAKSRIGKKHSDVTKVKLSESHKGLKYPPLSEETKRKLSLSKKLLWETQEFQNKMQSALHLKPNKPETVILNLLQELYPNQWQYTGDFTVWFGRCNPDFMNINGEKKLIELYGDYFHKGEDPQLRINHFKQFGFDTLIVWESELRNIELVKDRINSFIGKL